jgi:osmoprotectant transport system permease protein
VKARRGTRTAAAILATAMAAPAVPAAGQVVVGSKNFAENRLLGELFAQVIEARTALGVERRLGLAGTQLCFTALQAGAIDVYPEYTGTGLVTLLGDTSRVEATAALVRVRAEFARRWDLLWLAPLGFENAFEIAVPRPVAERHALRTISDLAAVAPQLRAAFGHEFATRHDGLPGLQRTYALRFRDVRQMQQALQYEAAAAGKIDCLDVYTTDGRLVVHDLVLLDDDREFFPPYGACALVRGATLVRYPELGTALGLLAGALDAATMRRLNYRVEAGGEPIERVAAQTLAALGLTAERAVTTRGTREGSFAAYMWSVRGDLAARTLEHLALAGAGLALGIAVAVPLGLWLAGRRRVAEPLIRAVGTTQTVPSLALLAFLVPFLGVGAVPAIAALWLYALFPILRNTYTGLRDASPSVVQAARAAGMTDAQVLRAVRLPLAVPTVLAGVRTAAVLGIGTATLAAFVGAGGLGEPIVSGVQSVDARLILSGALPAAALALAVDGVLAVVERRLAPRGLTARR